MRVTVPISTSYLPRGRAERLIAAGRVLLGAFSLLAILFDPSTPAKYAGLTYSLLGFYVVYAIGLTVLAWSAQTPRLRSGAPIHAVDLIFFTGLVYLTEGPASPFFAYFVFALVAAAIRWQWRGVLWTAGVTLSAFLGMGVYASEIANDPGFALNRFIIRSAYLVVMTGLLGYLSAHEALWRSEWMALADWPRILPREFAKLLEVLLAKAAAVVKTPRALLVWEDPEEPWRYLAFWTAGELKQFREPADRAHAVTPEAIAEVAFLSPDGETGAVVLRGDSGDVEHQPGPVVDPALRARFDMRSILSVPLRSDWFKGRLFLLDRAAMTTDELLLGGIVAQHLIGAIDQFLVTRSLERAAATEERLRLARDLHDNTLQAFSGLAMQLHSLGRVIDSQPAAAEEQLRNIERVLASEQRELRFFLRDLRPGPVGEAASLDLMLSRLVERIESVWNLSVELIVDVSAVVLPKQLRDQICRLLQEALVNVARHAEASLARAEVRWRDGMLQISVRDNGRGFAFHGQYDHDALTRERLGPVNLKERVTALGGSLSIESRPSGAAVSITLPAPDATHP